MQIDETVHGCPVGRRCGSPDRQVGDPGSPSQIRTTSGPPPLVAATGRAMEGESEKVQRNEHCGKIGFPVPKVVFEMVAVVLQNVEAFILDLPARPATG